MNTRREGFWEISNPFMFIQYHKPSAGSKWWIYINRRQIEFVFGAYIFGLINPFDKGRYHA